MKKITLTVDVDGSAVSREYAFDADLNDETWGLRVQDILDTIEKSQQIEF